MKNIRIYDLCVQKPCTNKEWRMEATLHTCWAYFAPKLKLKRSKMAPIRPQSAPQVPQEAQKWSAKSPQELPRALKEAKMDAQGASRNQNDAKVTTQGTSKSENDTQMITKGTSKPQNGPKWSPKGHPSFRIAQKNNKKTVKKLTKCNEPSHTAVPIDRPGGMRGAVE